MSSPSSSVLIRFRLSNIDTILSSTPEPYDYRTSPFTPPKDSLRSVPVIRIFGATDRGQRVVAHIHGAFPYVFVKYPGVGLDPDTLNGYIYKLGLILNRALSLTDTSKRSSSQSPQYIPYIAPCTGTPFYGYHIGPTIFLKIYLTNPSHKKRLCDLLRSGTVLKEVFEVYEEHIPFLLQFLADFNLFGCGWVELGEECRFRGPLPDHTPSPSDAYDPPTHDGPFPTRLYDSLTLPPSLLHTPSGPSKISNSPLEIDVPVSAILNRLELKPREIHRGFEEGEEGGRLVTSVKELWEDENRRRGGRGEGELRDTGEKEEERGIPIWQSEPALREKLKLRLEEDLKQYASTRGGIGGPKKETFVRSGGWRGEIKSSFENTDAVFVERMERDEREGYLFGVWAVKGIRVGVKKEELELDEGGWLRVSQSAGEEEEEEEKEEGWREQVGEEEEEEEEKEKEDEEEGVKEEEEASTTIGDDEPPSKKVKRHPSEDSPATSPPSPSPPPPPAQKPPSHKTRTKNPFSSPTKSPRVRFATTPTPFVEDDFNDLPENTFEDYVPTPTVVDRGPSVVPEHQRSVFGGVFGSGSTTEVGESGSGGSESEIEIEIEVKDEGGLSSSAETWVPPQASSFTVSSQDGFRSEILVSDSSASASASNSSPSPTNHYVYTPAPPTTTSLLSTLESYNLSRVLYKDPFYSKKSDIPKGAKEFGGRSFRLRGNGFAGLEEFGGWEGWKGKGKGKEKGKEEDEGGCGGWEFGERPPTREWIVQWLREGEAVESKKERAVATAQIEGPTQVQGGFKFVPAKGAPAHAPAQIEKQHLALLALEIHVNTRGKLLPDPEKDAIVAVFYCLQSENDDLNGNGRASDRHVGVIAVSDDKNFAKKLGRTNYVLDVVSTEVDLINLLADKVRYEWDPEIVAGYEIHNASWGYVVQRAKEAHDWCLISEFGRVLDMGTGRFTRKSTDREFFGLKFSGRHIFPVWRILAADNKLQRNSFEYAAFAILGLRTPLFSFETLTRWHQTGSARLIARVFEYWRNRVEMVVEMLEEAEIISQNCESARVFGIDFNSVRTRGSQYKVESIMFRIAKPESFLLCSPTRIEVGKQNAAECQPLVMEPKSAFYKGPLLVLDFQSLYPSIMIAYNYCYSTCLGRVGTFKGTQKLGTTTYNPAPGLLNLIKDDITISPNGLMFVKANVRKSLLAKMLGELLDTRVMVKGGMKGQTDKALLKLLNARQLALKFLANVTYGYTSATFSGRMPCVEIADAIVQTGRETLEKSLETIHFTPKWGAQVVYGDTDSLFVYLPGKSKEDAFKIGHEIAATITSQNPQPIKLKFEKVYLPSVLLAKKRYVGFKYETEADIEPEFDAKGIETVRRDGIRAVQKMQEACIKILFRTQDLSQVKDFCQRQWRKLMTDNVSPQDFTYAKEVKLGTYKAGHTPPPGAAVAARLAKKDRRAEPAHGERVPYILHQAEKDLRQVDRALTPAEFMADPRIRLDVTHYIQDAMIPPLYRIFILFGADVQTWYQEMSKKNHVHSSGVEKSKAVSLAEHFVTDRCIGCGEQDSSGDGGLCRSCRAHPSEVAYRLSAEARALARQQQDIHSICNSCSSVLPGEATLCESYDCPVLYSRKGADVAAKKCQELLANLATI